MTTQPPFTDADSAVRAQCAPDTRAEAARRAVRRLVGALADRVELAIEPSDREGEHFSVSPTGNRVRIGGSTAVALVSGFHWYLTHIAHGHLSRTGDVLPVDAPMPEEMVRRSTPYADRYIYNFTVNGYTAPYWTFDEWEREIDLIAAYGINRALVTTGLEEVWVRTFSRFGYPEQEIRDWICAPSLQPWQWMGNVSGMGPAPSPHLLERRVALGRRIIARMRELGIEPVLPGYQGIVPPGFADRVAGAKTVPQGTWGPFAQPDCLVPGGEAFQRVAAAYYEAQIALFGTAPHQAIDLFHEGGTAAGVDLGAATRGIEASLRDALGDGYRWVIQAWGGNPPDELLEAADRDRLLVLDLSTERDERWKTRDAFQGAPWALGILANVGGRNGLYGGLRDLLARVPATLTAVDRGSMSGLAVMLEGVQNQSPVSSALADLVWESEPLDAGAWIEDYATSRYGRRDEDALTAWRLLLRSAYATWQDWPSGADSLFNARPSLDAEKASPFGPDHLSYNADILHDALHALLRAVPRLREVQTFRYDVVDVARQILVNRSRALLPRLQTCYEARDGDGFDRLSEEFLGTAELTATVVATHQDFLLEPWLAQAEAWGCTADERHALRADAARLITVWGDQPAAQWVEDYANRDWAGLLREYYIRRWRRYLRSLSDALHDGTPPPDVDWYAEGARWAENPPRTATAPAGDPIDAARAALAAVTTPVRPTRSCPGRQD